MDECCHLGFHSPLAPCYDQNQSMFHNTSVQRHLYGLQNRRTADFRYVQHTSPPYYRG